MRKAIQDYLECYIDLLVGEAVYHILCVNKLRLKTRVGNKRCQPVDWSMVDGFYKVHIS